MHGGETPGLCEVLTSFEGQLWLANSLWFGGYLRG